MELFPETAKLEFNISERGLVVLGNRDGLFFLAQFVSRFLQVAVAEMADARADEGAVGRGAIHEHLGGEGPRAVSEGRLVFSCEPLEQLFPERVVRDEFGDEAFENLKDVMFTYSDVVGPDYWGPSEPSGATPLWRRYYGATESEIPPDVWQRMGESSLRLAQLGAADPRIESWTAFALASQSAAYFLRAALVARGVTGASQLDEERLVEAVRAHVGWSLDSMQVDGIVPRASLPDPEEARGAALDPPSTLEVRGMINAAIRARDLAVGIVEGP